jgi:hypothetical protein
MVEKNKKIAGELSDEEYWKQFTPKIDKDFDNHKHIADCKLKELFENKIRLMLKARATDKIEIKLRGNKI